MDYFMEESKDKEEQVYLSSFLRNQINQKNETKRYFRIETLHSIRLSP